MSDENEEEEADEDIDLRKYQVELASPAMDGKNVIIVAPTGSGKTRVAMRIIQVGLVALIYHRVESSIGSFNRVTTEMKGHMIIFETATVTALLSPLYFWTLINHHILLYTCK